MIPVRVFFRKLGRIKYIAHLDTMRTMTRAFKRSGLPFWYTQGFNPHLYSTFALPIALGYESECEVVDLRFTQAVDPGEAMERMNAAMPPGLEIFRVAEPGMDPNVIEWAQYRVDLYPGNAAPAELDKALEVFLSLGEIPVLKRSKKGERTVDIKPLMQPVEQLARADRAVLDIRLAAGNRGSVNPTLMLKAFCDKTGLELERVTVLRTRILDKNFVDFA